MALISLLSSGAALSSGPGILGHFSITGSISHARPISLEGEAAETRSGVWEGSFGQEGSLKLLWAGSDTGWARSPVRTVPAGPLGKRLVAESSGITNLVASCALFIMKSLFLLSWKFRNVLSNVTAWSELQMKGSVCSLCIYSLVCPDVCTKMQKKTRIVPVAYWREANHGKWWNYKF